MHSVPRYSWEEIHDSPLGKGVYAWYCQLTVSRFDIDEVIRLIESALAAGDKEGAGQHATTFLAKRIFSMYEQDDYQASIVGALMPAFSGVLKHTHVSSRSLIDRIVSEPQRLLELSTNLNAVAPLLSSPLYIGKSDNLRTRLMTHKRTIQKFRSMPAEIHTVPDTEDSSFAKRVVLRGIPPDKLFVCCLQTGADGDIHVDVENVLNRISYPILGRN